MRLSDRWVMQNGPMTGGWLLDGVLQDRISGEVGWQQKSYPLGGEGTHALVWVYSKDSGGESGSDRGWVDYLQWTPSAGGGSSTTDWEINRDSHALYRTCDVTPEDGEGRINTRSATRRFGDGTSDPATP